MAVFKGWRYAAFITGFVGLIGATLYPIAFSPMMDASEYKKIQKEARKNIRQEDIQPGNSRVRVISMHWNYVMNIVGRISNIGLTMINQDECPICDCLNVIGTYNLTSDMKVWSDPFGRKKPDNE